MSTVKRLHSVSFLVALLLMFLLIGWILHPYINILAFAIIIAILFHPVYKLLYQRIGKPAVASMLTVLIILAIIALPIWLFGHLIISELIDLYNRYQSGAFILDQGQIISSLPEQVQNFIRNFSQDINNFVGRVSNQLFSSVTAVVGNVASFVVAFFAFIFTVYYLLKDGKKIKQVLMDISPISSKQEDELINKVVAAVNGVVKGSFFVALVQAVVATIGYFIFGLPDPFVWGAFTFIAALVPNVGTALALIPAVIYLLVTGQNPQAIGMAIWGAVAVGLVDNFIGPRLVGNSARLHPVLVLLSVLGGLQFFGILGFLIGPIIMAVFVAMIEIYRDEFKDYINSK